jgi:hypothetical protein
VQELQGFGYKLIGIEMEGLGTALAVSQADYPLKMLMVKGICDWADDNKNDLWQAYAADVAAAYVVNFLKSKPIECRVLPNSFNRTRRTFLQLVGFGWSRVCRCSCDSKLAKQLLSNSNGSAIATEITQRYTISFATFRNATTRTTTTKNSSAKSIVKSPKNSSI